MSRRSLVFLALFFAVSPLAAQSLSERIDVSIIEADVVVTDADGKPVSGLTADDFELLVDGRPQKIVNFYAIDRRTADAEPVTPAPAAINAPLVQPPVTARRTFVVVFVDLLHLRQKGLVRSLDALRQFVTGMPKNTSVAVMAWDGSLSMAKGFTDTQSLEPAIEKLTRRSGRMLVYERQRRDLLHMIDETWRTDHRGRPMMDPDFVKREVESFVESETNMAARTVDALASVVRSSSGFDGRRIIVYLSDGLPVQPGAEIVDYMSGASGQIDSMRYDVRSNLKKLASDAANEGIQIFSIDAGGLRGYEAVGPDEETHTSRVDTALVRDNLRSSLQLLADETGGRAIIDRNDMSVAFAELTDHVTTYYSLGFRGDGSGKPRNIRVNVRRPGLTVRSGKSVREHSAEEQILARVRAGLYNHDETNPLDVRVGLAESTKKPAINFIVAVPPAKLAVVSDESGKSAGYDVYVAVLDEQLRESDVRRLHRDFASPQGVSIPAKPGKYVLSLAVVDSASGETSYLQHEVVVK